MNFMNMYKFVRNINKQIKESTFPTVQLDKEFFQDLEKVLRQGVLEMPTQSLFIDVTKDDG